jgi:hypothetical protein
MASYYQTVSGATVYVPDSPEAPKIDAEQAKPQNGCQDTVKPDMVNRPPHYTQGGIECIQAIRSAVEGRDGYEGYLTGQVMKYIWRYPFKGRLEDLEKARCYLDRLIQKLTIEEIDGHVISSR